jgi:hypothetical protein
VTVAIRESKRALAEVATLLGTDTASARTYLRRVQHLAGPTSYDTILAAMRRVDGYAADEVAAAITGARPETGE